jgi:hypothetical protein
LSSLLIYLFLRQEAESDQLDQMTAAQLKALCKEYGLKVSGNKTDLKQRLRERLLKSPVTETSTDEFDEMSDEELRQSLAVRGIHYGGDRFELLQRIRGDIQFIKEMEEALPPNSKGHASIMEALEATALKGGVTEEILTELKEKLKEIPKFRDITIESLGMEPLKYTVGGAPSVTADVLRQLAGDPFDDPPRYGLVSSLTIKHLLRDVC